MNAAASEAIVPRSASRFTGKECDARNSCGDFR
jgi:hypothetical protein